MLKSRQSGIEIVNEDGDLLILQWNGEDAIEFNIEGRKWWCANDEIPELVRLINQFVKKS